jgi:hypothetical protein
MNIVSTKTLIPNKEWIIEGAEGKIGSVAKIKKGYAFLHKGKQYNFKNLNELGIVLPEKITKSQIEIQPQPYKIYDYPCNAKPYGSVFNIQKKLPIFAKSNKSKSQFCAGYYIIKFRKGWVKSFCPKLITLERYQYHGPYKTEKEMKLVLSNLNKI